VFDYAVQDALLILMSLNMRETIFFHFNFWKQI